MYIRILFVDDDKNLLYGIKRNLRMKYDNVIADFESSPVNAIKKIDKYDYDVIVTDFNMPGINGSELLNIIKEKNPGITRFVLTGYMNDALKSSMINDSKIYFLSKPVVIGELMAAIEMAMKGG